MDPLATSDNADASPTSWHSLSVAEVAESLSSSVEGLSPTEAAIRLQRWGPNELPAASAKTGWAILRDQIQSVVMGLLAAAVFVSWIVGDTFEAAMIAVVILINVALGFVTEFRARQAILALSHFQASGATVLRGGELVEVPAQTLVPGDVVALEEGQRVPADLRLLGGEGLEVDEAILTGESAPVVKDPAAVVDREAAQHEQETMAFHGTAIVSGSARGFVTATGSRTAIGRIGQLLEEAPDAETPLEKKLDALGHQLIWLTLGVAALVTAVGALRGIEWTLMLKTGIALAVAAVPEGLPAIATIAMAIGVRRMARRNALVRRLPSVETLGSVTVVCTDKTGTLTTGRMAAEQLWLPSGGDEGGLLESAVFANRVAAMGGAGSDSPRFDPTEVALVDRAQQAGLDAARMHEDHPIIAQIPFTAARRFMASLHEVEDGARWYAKGSLEAILSRCATVRAGANDVALTPAIRDEIVTANDAFAADGLRVLGFAASPASSAEQEGRASEERSEPDALSFLGLIGLIDPPAPGVKDTVELFERAGIRVIMLTGDQHLTASAVGAAVGIGDGTPAIDMTGWGAHDAEATRSAVASASVFARVSPEQKLGIVEALQESGEIVAMLGDGVNDAAALKRADVGVAMGRRGAEVARQASAIILQDDRFETVGAAVAEGRVVFANIRKFAYYLFSCNLSEVLVLLIAGILGWPMPLLPLQILWLNLATDTFPALALAFEPGEEDLMSHPPRPPATPIIGKAELRGIFLYGAAITAVALVACYIGLRTEPTGGPRTMTLTFATLALAQIFHLGNVRSQGPVLAPARITANGYAIAGAAISIALLVGAISSAPVSRILSIAPLTLFDWILVFGLGAIPAILGQASKLVRGAHRA